jgi:hypothetical protein
VSIQPINQSTAITTPPAGLIFSADQMVINAWSSRQLSDGTRLNLGRTDTEQGFVVREDGIFPIAFTESGTQHCIDGSSRLANRINARDILPNSGGHTHPRGRANDVSGLPGPEDGVMAAVTRKTAYVISSRGAFAVDKDASGFHIRLLAGSRLTATEQGEISRLIGQWNTNNGGSGVRCTFTPN